jgi:RNA polymerase sigma-70 factor (ECF subfamily)
MEKTAEVELVKQAKAGDVSAFEALYRIYSNRIYNFALQLVGTAEDARDLTQEAFIRAWKALPKLRSEEAFGVWLHRITLNLGSDLLKNRSALQSVSLDTSALPEYDKSTDWQTQQKSSGPDDQILSSELEVAVRKALQSLSVDHRTVITMHHLEGMDIETIAKILCVPRGTVMSRLSRAREILRRKLAAYVEEG